MLCGRVCGQVPREIHIRLSQTCDSIMGANFRPDGQEWCGLIRPSNYVEYCLTFYAGVRYRFVCENTLEVGAVQYTFFDSEHNVLFKSDEHGNPRYWDFEFRATTICQVLMHEAPGHCGHGQKGYAMVRVGFQALK